MEPPRPDWSAATLFETPALCLCSPSCLCLPHRRQGALPREEQPVRPVSVHPHHPPIPPSPLPPSPSTLLQPSVSPPDPTPLLYLRPPNELLLCTTCVVCQWRPVRCPCFILCGMASPTGKISPFSSDEPRAAACTAHEFHVSIHLPICLSARLPVSVSVCLSVCQSVSQSSARSSQLPRRDMRCRIQFGAGRRCWRGRAAEGVHPSTRPGPLRWVTAGLGKDLSSPANLPEYRSAGLLACQACPSPVACCLSPVLCDGWHVLSPPSPLLCSSLP